MAINRTSLSGQSVKTNTDSVIEIRYIQPQFGESADTLLDPAETPGKLIGYYNGASGFVELYVVDPSGLRLLKI